MSKAGPTLVARAEDQIALWQLIEESGGELTPTVEAWLKEIETGLATKVDSYRNFIEDLQDEGAKLRRRAQELAGAAQSLERLADSMRDRIKFVMQQLGTDEVKGEFYRFKLSELKPKMVIDDLAKIPLDLLMTVTETVVDKERIRGLLDAGVAVPGARLEPVKSLRDYVNKGR